MKRSNLALWRSYFVCDYDRNKRPNNSNTNKTIMNEFARVRFLSLSLSRACARLAVTQPKTHSQSSSLNHKCAINLCAWKKWICRLTFGILVCFKIFELLLTYYVITLASQPISLYLKRCVYMRIRTLSHSPRT